MISNDQIISDGSTTFSQLQDTFANAASSHPTGCRQIDIRCAGHSIRLRTAGNKLAGQLAQAFGHLLHPTESGPELTIEIWDAAESGVQLRSDSNAQRKLTGFDILFRTSEDGRYFCEQRNTSLSWLDSASSKVTGFITSADVQYPDQLGRPFQKMIIAWLQEREIQSIHAGLVGVGDTGLLIVGSAGAGKTTSAISCLQAGMNYLGDDMVGLQAHHQGFQGHSLFATCLVEAEHLKRFPTLHDQSLRTSHAPAEKSVVYLNKIFPQQIKRSVPIRAIVLPNIVNQVRTTYRPATKADALFALAPTSVMFLPRPTQESFTRLAEMVKQIPAYWLDLGNDLNSIPVSIRNLATEVIRG